MRRRSPRLLACAAPLVGAAACLTVDPGDDFPPPEARLDEGAYHCVIQPTVVTAFACASGGPGGAGGCHAEATALRLDPAAEALSPPPCDGTTPLAPVPEPYAENLERVRPTTRADPAASPFFRRPTGLDPHPVVLFAPDSPEATRVLEWLAAELP